MKETPTQTLVNTILELSREIMESTRRLDESRRETKAEQNGSALLQNQIAGRDQLIEQLNAQIVAAKTREDALTANVEQWKLFYDRKSDELAKHVSERPKLEKLHQAGRALVRALTRVTATTDVGSERYALEVALADTDNYLDEIPF